MTWPRMALILAIFLISGLRSAEAVEVFEDGSVSPALSPTTLSDPGLVEGESAGCKLSTIDGLVYFCGFVKNADTSEPLEGITVAVYEELPPQPPINDPEGLYSGSGKYGGNLVHLFTSTSTNVNGHYEITGRQAHNVYVAFLCGQDLLGGMKRIEDLSRIEYLDEFVECDNSSYIEPLKQLNYVDREGFLECTVDFLREALDGSPTGVDPQTVGYSSTPTYSALSEIHIDNFDYRFLPRELALESLGLSNEILGMDFVTDNDISPGADWITRNRHGAWREADCVSTYEDDRFCNPVGASAALGGDDAYLVLNHLRFIPPWPSKPAFARVDNRTSLRQVNQSNSAIARYMDAVFGNYMGEKAIVKQPGSEDTITEAEFGNDPSLISCDALRDTMSIDLLKQTSGPGAMLRSPGEIENDVSTIGALTEDELNSPICRESGSSLVTVKQACFDQPWLGLCRPEHLLPKGTGSALYPFTSQESADSLSQEEVVRGNKFSLFNTEIQRPWKDQDAIILTGERNVAAARNPISASFVSGGPGFGTKNYLGVLSSPDTSLALTEDDTVVSEEQKALQKQEVDVKVGDTPDVGITPQIQPTPNAMKKDIVVEDISSDAVGHCTISTIYGDAGSFNNLVRNLLNPTGFTDSVRSFVSNFFTGNPDHLSDEVSGSGTFYTSDSLIRDRYLNSIGNSARDTFDSLRSMATSGTIIDFSQLTDLSILLEYTSDLAEKLLSAIDLQNEAQKRVSKSGEIKSFGERSENQGANGQGLVVTYDLNETNFQDFFPTPRAGSQFLPGNWGEHPYYPWDYVGEVIPEWRQLGNVVPPGERCNTAADEGGISSTCRVAACGTVGADVSCDPITGRCNVEDPRASGLRGDCTATERRTCAENQETTDFELSDQEEFRLGQNAIQTGNRNQSQDYTACVMQRAGPYIAAPPLHYEVSNLLVQQDTSAGDVQVKVDALASSVENLGKAFSSPAQQFIDQRSGAEADIAHSISPDDSAVVTRGYPITGIGGVTPSVYSASAPVTGAGGAGPDNQLYYHCNNLGVDVDGIVRGGDWNCPITTPPVCSGLFGQVSGIERLPISPAGQTAISSTFSFGNFQQSLEVYAQIEIETGVPCEVMAGVHYREAGNSATGSFEDGGSLRNGSLLEDGLLVADDLLNDVGLSRKPNGLAFTSIEQIARALLAHNGWGNNNCSAPTTLTNYSKCPAAFPGEDNNYIMAYADSNHDNMAIIYPADYTRADSFCSLMCSVNSAALTTHKTACGLCPPPIEELRVGALVLAKYLYNLGATSFVR